MSVDPPAPKPAIILNEITASATQSHHDAWKGGVGKTTIWQPRWCWPL